MSRPAKRKRAEKQSAYHDPVPNIDDFSLVHAREGRLRRVGNNFVTSSTTSRLASHVAGSWNHVDIWAPPDDPQFALQDDGWYDEAVDAPSYLEEMIRWEGRGDFMLTTHCPDCIAKHKMDPGSAQFRCEECMIPDLTCADCCVKQHRHQSFHHIQRWDNDKFCRHLQLLRRRLYPASQITVKCCATFELLGNLHKLALTTKASTYDFYHALEKMTSNVSVRPPRSLRKDKSVAWISTSRYRALFHMIMQWRHLKMLKWSGRGHDPIGVAGTRDGELAVECPSCPIPGVNLPEGWDQAPENRKFLYMLIVCMDANFRLKNQVVSNHSQDPGLGSSWAYFVPRIPYENYVLSRTKDADISTCVSFQALAKANTKFSVGLRYTGLHEPMHQTADHQVYSLNYIPGVGLADCECPERVWGPHNCLGNSTKTQGPGSRQDVLDDHFGFWNWVKTASVKKRLAEEEKQRVDSGGACLHNTSPWAFVSMGLDLEETQLAKGTATNTTVLKEGNLTEQRNVLRSRLRAWEQVLPIYMPGIVQYRADLATQEQPSPSRSPHPEDAELWLPSRIPIDQRGVICTGNVASIEENLCDAQLQDALDATRRILKLKSRMINFKNRNIRGQKDGLKSSAMIDRVHDRARSAVEKYWAAREAKLKLAGAGDWEKTYQRLEDSDVRAYQDPNRLRQRTGRKGVWDDEQVERWGEQPVPTGETIDDRNFLFNETRSKRDGTGATRLTLSWIWLNNPGSSSQEDDDSDVMRVEWAKSRARAARATEEVMLLKEEMRRVLAYMHWKEKWWIGKMSSRAGPGVSKDLEEGLRVCASSQVEIRRSLRQQFQKLWEMPLEEDRTAVNNDRPEGDSDDNDDEDSDDGDDDEDDIDVEGDGDIHDVDPVEDDEDMS
ncbi:hypothetical protein CPC08DRAFT_738695 [Agrocybe pediades]|nr:hypothetical protein CPC08DRAFT_738695 [Agrocybe pediades]